MIMPMVSKVFSSQTDGEKQYLLFFLRELLNSQIGMKMGIYINLWLFLSKLWVLCENRDEYILTHLSVWVSLPGCIYKSKWGLLSVVNRKLIKKVPSFPEPRHRYATKCSLTLELAPSSAWGQSAMGWEPLNAASSGVGHAPYTCWTVESDRRNVIFIPVASGIIGAPLISSVKFFKMLKSRHCRNHAKGLNSKNLFTTEAY